MYIYPITSSLYYKPF